jgi:hypothetical protein
MKYYSILLTSIFFPGSALLSGCTTTNTTDVTSVQPVSTGTIIGYVSLEDMNCYALTSFAGATAELIGTKKTAISDSAGNCIFDSVPAGYYYMSFQKPGFTRYVTNEPFDFVGAGTLRNGADNGSIEEIDNWKTTLNTPSITKDSALNDTIFALAFPQNSTAILDSAGKNVVTGANTVWGFFSKSPNINYEDSATFFVAEQSRVEQDAGILLGPNFTINAKQAHSGDTVYLIVYPLQCGDYSYTFTYYDQDSVKTAYNNLGRPSNTVKVILP